MRAGFAVLAISLAALGGCSRIGDTRPEAPAAAAHGCAVSATSPWHAGAVTLQVEANASGPDCAHAVATIAVRDPTGKVLFTEARATEFLMVLSEAHDAPAMQEALANWIAPDDPAHPSTTGTLPDWPQGAENPSSGQFPFFPNRDPENEISRDAYLTLRTGNAPMLCYMQGMESMTCLAFQDGAVINVGTQIVPG